MKRVLVLLVLVAACGGSGDDGAAAKEAYLGKAESVCAKAVADLATAKKGATTADKIPGFVHQVVDIARATLTDLSVLEAPADDKADLEAKVLTPLREQLVTGDAFTAQVDAAVKAKDNAKLFDLVTHPPTQTKADLAFMKQYGFKDCVKAADTSNATK